MSDTVNSEHLRPHCETCICGKCRKPIGAGHRVTQAMIAISEGRDPRNVFVKGMMLAEEWELVHIDCNDPLLVKGLDP